MCDRRKQEESPPASAVDHTFRTSANALRPDAGRAAPARTVGLVRDDVVSDRYLSFGRLGVEWSRRP